MKLILLISLVTLVYSFQVDDFKENRRNNQPDIGVNASDSIIDKGTRLFFCDNLKV
jgi:hypothetical protein